MACHIKNFGIKIVKHAIASAIASLFSPTFSSADVFANMFSIGSHSVLISASLKAHISNPSRDATIVDTVIRIGFNCKISIDGAFAFPLDRGEDFAFARERAFRSLSFLRFSSNFASISAFSSSFPGMSTGTNLGSFSSSVCCPLPPVPPLPVLPLPRLLVSVVLVPFAPPLPVPSALLLPVSST